jgi:hypothetical protein
MVEILFGLAQFVVEVLANALFTSWVEGEDLFQRRRKPTNRSAKGMDPEEAIARASYRQQTDTHWIGRGWSRTTIAARGIWNALLFR